MEGILNTPNPNPKLNYPAGRTPEPFVFGSPLPQHRVSDVQFRTAAASVLEEMNKRLQQDGIEGVDTSVISRLHPGTHSAADLEPRELKPLPRLKGEFKGKFDQKHDEEFQKMEGIDGFVKRRGISPNKDEVSASGPVVIGKKRKSSVVALNDGEGPRRPIGARRASGTRVVSKKLPKAPIPGAFGDDDDEEEVDERAGKRIRVASDSSQAKGSSVGVRVTQSEQDKIAQEKERQAIKRKLELNKAKRRSSGVPGGMQGRRSGRISGGLGKLDPFSPWFSILTVLQFRSPNLRDSVSYRPPNLLSRAYGAVIKQPLQHQTRFPSPRQIVEQQLTRKYRLAF